MIYTARWVVPVSSPPIADGAVVVLDGRIAAIGPAASITRDHTSASMQRVDLGDVILMPGLINVHAHPELSFLRGALEDLPFHQWIPRLRRIKTALALTPDELRDAARWTCAEAAAAGITALGATEDSDAALHALRDAGMRGVAFREVFAPAPEGADTALQGLRAAVEEMRAYETDLVRVGISPHAPYTVSDALFTAVADYASAEHLEIAVHTAESDTEHSLVTRGDGAFAEGLNARGIDTPPRSASTVALLQRTGILDLAPLLIHCVRVGTDDIATIKSSGANIAHCPVANARLGHGIAPVTEMLAAGVNVGLGSDSVAANNRVDMLEEGRTAQILQRARLLSPTALTSNELLRMVTIDGARALRIDDRVGTLDVGKDADMCAISLGGTHSRPVFDPVSALFMSCRGSDAALTMVRGVVIYRAGVHEMIDTFSLGRRIDAIGTRVREVVREAATAT